MSGLNIQYDSSSNTISSITFNKEFSNEINFTKLVSVYNKFISDTSTPNNAYIYLDNNNNLKFVQMSNMLCYNKNVSFLGASVTISTETDTTAKVYSIDLENETYTLDIELEPSGYIYDNSNYNWNYYNLNNKTIPFNIVNSEPANFNHICIGDATSSNTSYTNYIEENDCYIDTSSYLLASTQLSATPDYVYEKEFYGKNGIETGTLGTPDNSFADTNAEVYSKIQNYYDNLEPRVLTDGDKTIDKNIYFIPVKKDGTVLLDTSKVTNMEDMFYNCKSLTTISLLNTSKVTNMNSMFQNCTSLTEIPLLNTSNVTNMGSMFANCTNLTEIPLLDTSKVTDMISMFANCISLTTIPLLDTSKVTSITGMDSMFADCTSLSDESLNNILAMCKNATSYTGTKTLAYIGLSEEQATKCTTLSNYSAFTSAGWTTGY